MAVVLSEEQLRCCICLGTYENPVSIPCGHNFCLSCVVAYWDTTVKPVCPMCKETFSPLPDLRINKTLSKIVEYHRRCVAFAPFALFPGSSRFFRVVAKSANTSKENVLMSMLYFHFFVRLQLILIKSERIQRFIYFELLTQCRSTQEGDGQDDLPPETEQPPRTQAADPGDIPCDVCCGDKLPAVRSCLVCQASYCGTHAVSHQRATALQRHWLSDPVTFADRNLCRNHKQPLVMFCKRDQMPLCVQCVQQGHKKHETVAMEEVSSKVKVRFYFVRIFLPQNEQRRTNRFTISGF